MDTLSLILMIIGAINWGLVGIFQFDLVAAICGSSASVVARIIYTLVGLAGIWGIALLCRRDGRKHDGEYGSPLAYQQSGLFAAYFYITVSNTYSRPCSSLYSSTMPDSPFVCLKHMYSPKGIRYSPSISLSSVSRPCRTG